ncbi:diacylglycerol kinase family protein [uncultured Phascolarctobacterium sp.]|uniref:diacylglycerol/lipid kinase family protein n=1 Tax=uncultured Phascolarctobacterium sp. TaxID=512296 RepID=UPI00260A57BC|nr:diacylglycerol kinase family protein [uncultured Phascolarctobacterium sp.]
MPNRVDISSFQKVMIVYNRNSGKQLFASMLARVNEVKKRLKQFVDPKNLDTVEIRSFQEVEGLATRICQEKYDWVIVAGGDGTLRAMIDVFTRQGSMPYVSVFPAGTVNLVAKELLMSNDPAKWAKRVAKGIVTPVQLGKANGHIFLTVAGIGFDSLVVDNVSELEKKFLSKLAYVWQGTEMMRKEFVYNNWRYQFQVRLDDEEKWYDAASVIVGKSRYYAGRYSLFTGASLSAPQLHVAIFTGNTRADFMRYAAVIAMEALPLDKSIIIKKANKIEIRCNVEDFAAELDGDAITSAPLQIELHPVPINFLA